MKDVPAVDVLDGEADLEEDEEDQILVEKFPPLARDEREEISASTELHDDLESGAGTERFFVEDNVGMLHVREQGDLS